jgi:multidrug resistance efflux pump
VSDSFPRTMRALQRDGMNPTVLGLILITALIGFWCCWLVLGRVTVYEISAAARLEVERVHPVAASMAGRVVASSLSLGRQVRRGEILLEIEADRAQLETSEERTRLAALGNQLKAIETEIASEEEGLALTSRASRASLSEATQKLAVTEAAARQAEGQHARARQLGERGLMAEADLVRAQAEAEGRRAEVAAAHSGIERIGAQQAAAESEQRGHLAALVRERVTLEGQRATAVAAVTRLERAADERLIRAPVDGRLGEIAPVQVGAVIREGEPIASIVANGPVRVVAEFLPPALGRLHAGLPARVRLDGFPWTQYGYVRATVQSVASETREGRVRVELAVQRSSSSAIPLEHGLPGAVEVEVERAAPVALVVRTLGRALTTSDARPEPDAAPERARQ